MAWWRRRRNYNDYGFGYFPPSTPREAKGGIKAQTKRGAFGESWWAKRWIQVLESFNIGARLGRGRSYARSGQVLTIDIQKGLVTAGVQGSRPKPYNVTIKMKTLGRKEWAKLGKVLSQQAAFAARLLAGQMPETIEDAFKSAGLSLFPQALKDLETDCSCPDWSNPCKHIAAVYYLIGEEFDRDPFLILKLRGIDREELIGMLGDAPAPETGEVKAAASVKRTRSAKSAPAVEAVSPAADDSTAPAAEASPAVAAGDSPAVAAAPAESLAIDADAFWGKPAEAAEAPDLGDAEIPRAIAALPRRLGKFPFWRGDEDFLTTLEGVYCEASAVGLRVFLSGVNGEGT
jgi:uncharacterized Zn finger protein